MRAFRILHVAVCAALISAEASATAELGFAAGQPVPFGEGGLLALVAAVLVGAVYLVRRGK